MEMSYSDEGTIVDKTNLVTETTVSLSDDYRLIPQFRFKDFAEDRKLIKAKISHISKKLGVTNGSKHL